MTVQQLLRVLWARRKLALAVLGAIVLVAMAVNLLMPRTYLATTSLVVEQRLTDPVTGANVQTQNTGDYLATQVDVIASHNVASKVVERFKLDEVPVVRSQFLRATGGAGTARDWLADQLLESLQVTPSRSSSVIEVAFYNEDALFAAQMANAFAEAYIQTNLELKVEPAKRQAAWYQDQVLGLRKTLETAQKRLADAQREEGQLGSSNRLDVESAQLSDLSSQLAAAQGIAADTQSRERQLRAAQASGKTDQLPDILSNSLMQSMKADLARAEGKLADIAERYGTGHPQYTAALAEVSSLRTRLRGELATVTGAIGQSAALARQRVEELTSALDQQKKRIVHLQQGNDVLGVLQRDVDSAQRAYDAGLQRASEVRLQSQLNETSVAVLNPAITPVDPARPRVLLNMALALVLGVLFGVAAALLAEMFDRRVRSAADVADISGLEVLTEVPP